MKIVQKVLRWFLYFLAIPVTYCIISLILTVITIGKKDKTTICGKTVFLQTNGLHLDIIMAVTDIDSSLLRDLVHYDSEDFISFGWGDENFYINTPTWGELTFNNAFKAVFLKSSSLMHVTRYEKQQNDWVEIAITEQELSRLNDYIQNTFYTDHIGSKTMLYNSGYTNFDNFYKAKGSYSCFKTCNTWVNSGFLHCDLKACVWTPFDFGLIGKYQ